MAANELLLSSGSFPWFSLSQIISLAKTAGFDGIELVPSSSVINDVRIANKKDLLFIKALHHSWRKDIGEDQHYGIAFTQSLFFFALRSLFFPNNKTTNKAIRLIESRHHIPLTVHSTTDKWICDEASEPLAKQYYLEILNMDITPKNIERWIAAGQKIAVDTRDDQSLAWGEKYGFSNWQDLWEWIDTENIGNLQVTLIGNRGISHILSHKPTLSEEQFLFLHERKWKGSVTLEINPLMLFLHTKGDVKKGLREINHFMRKTLEKGTPWSKR